MGYGLAHGSKSIIQTLGQKFFQHIIMSSFMQIHESGNIGCDLYYGICGRKKHFFNLDIHEDKTLGTCFVSIWIW